MDGLLGMGQCAVAPAGKLDKSQEDLGDEAGVEEKFSFVHRCGHAVLIRAGGDSFGGWEDEVRFWQDGWCRVLAKGTLVCELLYGRTGPSGTGASSCRTGERWR